MIRVDEVWMAAQPLDMRMGSEAALARVVSVFGAAHPHHAYEFANRRANRMKALVHDGIGVWLVARRLNVGKFVWSAKGSVDFTRFNRHLLRSKLNWRVSHEESQISGGIQS